MVLNALLNIFQGVKVLCNRRPIGELFLVHGALIHIGLIFIGIIDDPHNQSVLCDCALDFVVSAVQATTAEQLLTFLFLLHALNNIFSSTFYFLLCECSFLTDYMIVKLKV